MTGKSSTKDDAAPVAAVPESGKKVKRSGNDIEEAVCVKRQKVEEAVTMVAAEQKPDEREPVKKVESKEDSSDCDDEPKDVTERAQNPATNGDVQTSDKEEKVAITKAVSFAPESDEEKSDSDTESSDDELMIPSFPASMISLGLEVESSESSSDESSSDEESSDDEPSKAPAQAYKRNARFQVSTDEDAEDSSVSGGASCRNSGLAGRGGEGHGFHSLYGTASKGPEFDGINSTASVSVWGGSRWLGRRSDEINGTAAATTVSDDD